MKTWNCNSHVVEIKMLAKLIKYLLFWIDEMGKRLI